jgi:uncharacterized repeat protein (TIGR03803 family)
MQSSASGRNHQGESHTSTVAAWVTAMLALVLALVNMQQTALAQSYTILYSFTGANGGVPGNIIRDGAGNIYGVSPTGDVQNCYQGCGFVFRLDPTGKFTVLYTFQGPPDGASPEGVAVDAKDNLYGTTEQGGTASDGTVFELTSSGEESILHSFAGPPNDGYEPYATLIRDPKGNLYGTTIYGGATSAFGNPGEGTIFKVTPVGKESILYSFTGEDDGGLPEAPLFLAGSTLYGTTAYGGNGPCGDIFGTGCGTVFKWSSAGESVLYSFQGSTDGSGPVAPVITDASGNVYGTASTGGDLSCPEPGSEVSQSRTPHPLMEQGPTGCGVVFRISPTGGETVLHSFNGTTDGSWPLTGVVMDSVGNLYGTTEYGGDLACEGNDTGCGTLYKIDTSGNFTVLHTFTGSEGAYPGQLIIDSEGNLYGPARGGPADYGVVFEITP